MTGSRAISSLEMRNRRLSFFVSRLAIVAITGHSLILVFSLLCDARPLVIFNIGSISLYTVLFFLNRTGRYTTVLIATTVEVLAHAAVATILLGWDAAFHLYILCLIPLLYYVDRWPLRLRGAASVVVLLTYLALAVISDQITVRLPPRSVALLPVLRYGNMATTAGVLIALSVFYQAAVSRAEYHMHHYSRTLEKLSNADPLTGVLNRRGTITELDRAIALGARTGTETAVILLDLDHFKSVNDTYGHETGDQVLKAVATVARTIVRGSDSFGRWGGEEFLAVLYSTDSAGAVAVAERIREGIAAIAIPMPGHEDVHITGTIGVAIHRPGSAILPPEKARTTIVSAADTALYEGKAAGRNRVVCAPQVVNG